MNLTLRVTKVSRADTTQQPPNHRARERLPPRRPLPSLLRTRLLPPQPLTASWPEWDGTETRPSAGSPSFSARAQGRAQWRKCSGAILSPSLGTTASGPAEVPTGSQTYFQAQAAGNRGWLPCLSRSTQGLTAQRGGRAGAGAAEQQAEGVCWGPSTLRPCTPGWAVNAAAVRPVESHHHPLPQGLARV